MTTITLSSLTVEYPSAGYVNRPIDGLDAEIPDGAMTLLLGPSGCGKTTLLSCLGGLLRPTSGRLLIGDVDLVALADRDLVVHRRERVGIVFQSFNLIASLNARDNVAAPLISQGVRRRIARRRADAILEQVGLTAVASSRPGQLSGGQQQRVAVARGLIHDPEILIADEPTANLDWVQAEAVIGLLRTLARPGRSVVVSTHDDRLLPIADHVIDLTPSIDIQEVPGRVRLAAGETLFQQGERGSLVYVIESGRIAIVQRGPAGLAHVADLGPGQYLGELGPMMSQPRSATARAAEDTEVTALTLQEFRARGRSAVAKTTTRSARVDPT